MASQSFPIVPLRAITAAGTITAGGPTLPQGATAVVVQSIFDYGSGGTSCKVYLQTSLDGGATWFDVAQHAFATADATKVSALNANIAPAAQAFTPGDGALADNTVANGALGDRLRVKVVSAGTYAATTIKVDVVATG